MERRGFLALLVGAAAVPVAAEMPAGSYGAGTRVMFKGAGSYRRAVTLTPVKPGDIVFDNSGAIAGIARTNSDAGGHVWLQVAGPAPVPYINNAKR